MHAVFDVGKTNKKIVLYDDFMQMVTIRKFSMETMHRDGLDIENVEKAFIWCLNTLSNLNKEYQIKTISICTHGAMFVCLDKTGHINIPPIAYTNHIDESFHQEFWDEMGDAKNIQCSTATAEIKPLVNAGKMIWFIKKKWPKDFEHTKNILMYPQYFAYRLTGEIAADITSVGCHSYFWDYERNDWSDLVQKLGIIDMLPSKPKLPTEAIGTITRSIASRTGLSFDTKVMTGIHDSNASLIPYLISQQKDFILNSTGTWCVAMKPADSVIFTDDELGKMVYYNLSYKGNPVKTSILMGGMEYESYVDVLMQHHGRSDYPDFIPENYKKILADRSAFILPSIVPGTGQFPQSVARIIEWGNAYKTSELLEGKVWPEVFDNYELGIALANLSLAIQTTVALRRVGLKRETCVFIEGGFRKNGNYTKLLKALLPDNPVFVTSIEEASSYGTALTAKAMADGVDISSLSKYVKMEKKPIEPIKLNGLDSYLDAYLRLI